MRPYFLTDEERDRIDILKFLSIVLVVYIHSYTSEVLLAEGNMGLSVPSWLVLVEDGISQTVARCAVPLFYLISSLLLFQRPRAYAQTLCKKVRTLLIPYLVFNSLWIGVVLVLQLLPFTSSYFLRHYPNVLGASASQWLEMYGIGADYPLCYPLWFMRDLMAVTLLFPVVARLARQFPRVLLGLTLILLLIPVDFPLKTASLWFVIGACLVELRLHLTVLDAIPLWLCSLVYGCGALAALFTESDLLQTLSNVLGVLYCARLSASIYRCAPLRRTVLKLSQWTFMIYGLHELTIGFAKVACLKILPLGPAWVLAEYLLLPVAVMSGCIAVGILLKKGVPRLYAFCTGER